MTDADGSRLEQPGAFSLLFNLLPLLHLASGIALLGVLGGGTGSRLGWLALWIYLLPPFCSRLMIAVWGRPEGSLTQDMPAYRVWWVLTQWQILFNRFPWLEEGLRLVPGLYALWIAMWGGRLSPRAYVAPGVWITDRHAVRVEAGAVLGMKSILCGHLVRRDEAGRWLVLAGTPVVEAEAILGGDARLGPGAILRAGEVLPTGRFVRPFEAWPRRQDDAADQ
ncbi:MAG: hypothetical protein D3M94_07535 [Rhodocyclales bacterium GT-UBC]|nr:MAG: hypothetical protein D3M94_07535 [Rhodocyclales bacterium GT-UBC]